MPIIDFIGVNMLLSKDALVKNVSTTQNSSDDESLVVPNWYSKER